MRIPRLRWTPIAILALSSCVKASVTVTTPSSGSTVACSTPPSCSVAVRVDWVGGQINGPPTLALDNAAVPNALAFPGGGAKGAMGTLTMAPGSHTITAYATLTDGASIKNYSATSTFTVAAGPPGGGGGATVTVAVQPNALAVERGKSGTSNVTVTRTGFTGDVTITVGSLPTGVTAAPLTVPAAMTSGTLQIDVSPQASFQQANLTLTAAGPGGTPTSTAPAQLALKVPRAAGAFVEASPTPYTNGNAGAVVASASGTFAVDIKTGTQLALAEPLGAVFRKGTTQVGQPIGFSKGTQSNLGGAGFCRDTGTQPTLTRGVVLTSAPAGSNAQYGFSFIDLMGNPTIVRQIEADGSKTNPTVIAPPKVFFSPDCTIALVAGVNVLGPSNYAVTLRDLQTGNPLAGSCGQPIQFSSANAFSALVRTQGTATQVEVKVDPGLATAQTCTYTVP
jgi:hypothetical protein